MKLATIGPDVRLIVVQFLMRTEFVPDIIPQRRVSDKPSNVVPSGGREVMRSTKGVYLLGLLDGIHQIDGKGPYDLVDCWVDHRIDGKSSVRFVFCHKSHIESDKLFADFVAKRDEFIDSFVNLADQNLWTTMGHLNPFFNQGKPSDHDNVLMISCAGRQPTVDNLGYAIKVPQGGKDANGQGIGPKIPITDRAPKLVVVDGDIVLN